MKSSIIHKPSRRLSEVPRRGFCRSLAMAGPLSLLGAGCVATARPHRPHHPRRPDFAPGQIWDRGTETYNIVMIDCLADEMGEVVAWQYDLFVDGHLYTWLESFTLAETADWQFLFDPWEARR